MLFRVGTVCGVYTTPALHVAISGMLTNTHCTSPYRGAGRPEASYLIERFFRGRLQIDSVIGAQPALAGSRPPIIPIPPFTRSIRATRPRA